MKYKISIIIPVYNIENHLENTLNSLITQTIGIENLEIIIVNDFSTDGTAKIIKKYTDKYENFKSVNLHKNSGLPGKPRNIGLGKATSNFVMFMDHDDFYTEDACEVLYNKITEENADMVFCNFKFIFDDGPIKSISRYRDEPEIKVDSIMDDNQLLALSPSIWTKIFRRNFLLENNILFPEGILAEDLSFFIHSLIKAKGIIFLNNYYGYNYRIRNSELDKSTIHIKNKKFLHAMILGYNDTYNILKREKKTIFFPVIFKGNLEYWMNCFITSNTTKSEKLELLKEAAFLFEKQGESNIKVDEIYLDFFEKIQNKKFDDAILISKISYIFMKNEIILKNKYKNLHKSYRNLQKLNKSYENKLRKMELSHSWKLTKPLRSLVNKIKIF